MNSRFKKAIDKEVSIWSTWKSQVHIDQVHIHLETVLDL